MRARIRRALSARLAPSSVPNGRARLVDAIELLARVERESRLLHTASATTRRYRLHDHVALAEDVLSLAALDIVVPTSVRVGDSVPITLRLTNTGSEPTVIHLQGRPVAFDIIITRQDGIPVWRRLEGAVVSAILQVRTLAPGEVIDFSDTWTQKNNSGAAVEPGSYTITGILPTDPPLELRTDPAPIRILPR
jgi:hypothetical protein